jgi:dipeptidyl aminopeptidase/acylaminoacyl peptidase
VILFDTTLSDPIRRVADTGGVPTIAVTRDDARKEAGASWPFFLPDGRHFLFLANDSRGPVAVKVGSLDTADVTLLGDTASRVEYSAGHLFYVSQRTLMARPFSTETQTFTGDPFPVADRVQIRGAGLVDFSTSIAGDLAYSSSGADSHSRLVWVDRMGKELGTVGAPALYRDIALSPDETRVAVGIGSDGPRDGQDSIWVVEVKRGVMSRLTLGNDFRGFPVWSADGSRVIYTTTGKDGAWRRIVQRQASGAGDELPLVEDKDGIIFPTDWSADGKQIVIGRLTDNGENFDVLTMAADSPGVLTPFAHAPRPIIEDSGMFSPDGRWLAYRSNESGRSEIYVQAFPRSGGKWQVSTSGANGARWGANGGEIVYSTADDTFYAVAIRVAGARLEIGLPVKLFQRRLYHSSPERNHWTAARDGQRLMLNAPIQDNTAQTIQVVLGWTAGSKTP